MTTSVVKGCLIALAATLTLTAAAHAQLALCPDGPCRPIDPSIPRRPAQFVSQPDMSLQFSTCLGSATGAFVATTVRTPSSAPCRRSTQSRRPAAQSEVRHSCVNGKSTWGGWLRPVGGYGAHGHGDGRNVGLSQVNTLAAGEASRSTSSRSASPVWSDSLERPAARLDDDGNADPAATSISRLRPVLPERGLLRAADRRSHDHRLVRRHQNTDIAIDIDDFLTVSQYGQLNCETYAWVHHRATIDTILASLTGGAGGSLGDVLGQGPGCQIANRLPRTVLVPQSAIKAVFTYTRVNSFPSTGLTAGGTWALVNRQPWVDVQGPFSLLAEPGEVFAGAFTVYPHDLRAPFTISWSSLNATPVPNASHPTIVWSLPNLALGSQTQRTLSATVIDADGNSATGYQTVILKRVADSDPISPLCKAKPWLDQCQ